jgi:hypothetical protein
MDGKVGDHCVKSAEALAGGGTAETSAGTLAGGSTEEYRGSHGGHAWKRRLDSVKRAGEEDDVADGGRDG